MYSYSFAYKVIRSAFFLLWLALAVGLICLVCELMWPAEFAAWVGVFSLAAVVPGGRKGSQLDLFGVNDTPLFSGSPVRVKDSEYISRPAMVRGSNGHPNFTATLLRDGQWVRTVPNKGLRGSWVITFVVNGIVLTALSDLEVFTLESITSVSGNISKAFEDYI